MMKLLNRRQFVTRMSMSASAGITLSKFGYSSPGYFKKYASVEEYVDVEITHGKIRGVRTEGVNIFKGVPYGGRISGDRRFLSRDH